MAGLSDSTKFPLFDLYLYKICEKKVDKKMVQLLILSKKVYGFRYQGIKNLKK